MITPERLQMLELAAKALVDFKREAYAAKASLGTQQLDETATQAVYKNIEKHTEKLYAIAVLLESTT